MFAGVAMMRLAQRFGTDVYDELIKTWLPVGDSCMHGGVSPLHGGVSPLYGGGTGYT
jgi:hypothetical protein